MVCTLALVLTPGSAAGVQDPCTQINPPPPPSCYGVSVTPKGDTTATLRANTGGYSAIFAVQRTGNIETYTIGCQGSGNITCTGVSPSSVSDFANVGATYSVGA